MLRDLQYGFRILLRNPGLAGVTGLALAVGIGLNTAVFSLVDAVLIRGLPYHDSARIIHISSLQLETGVAGDFLSYPSYLDLKTQARSYEELAAYVPDIKATIVDGEAPAQQYDAARVTANAFSLLGQPAYLGRGLLAGEDSPEAEPVVLIGYGLWQDRYGGDPAVLGRSIRVDDAPRTIVGVLPEGVRFPRVAQVWIPYVQRDGPQSRSRRQAHAFGRLRESVSVEQAQTEIEVIADRLRRQFPDEEGAYGLIVQGFNDYFNGGIVGPLVMTLFGAAGFILLIAWANVLGLTLVRAASRTREMSIRSALGASRWRVTRQLFAEGLLLALVGGAAGMIFAFWVVRIFDLSTAAFRPYWVVFDLNWRVAGYWAAVCLVSGALFGLAPAVQLAWTRLADALKEGGRGSTGGRRTALLASLLTISELILAIVLVSAAGLMVRSFWNHLGRPVGADPDGLLTMQLSLPSAAYPRAADRVAFQRRLLDAVAQVPGVDSLTTASYRPGLLSGRIEVEIVERPELNTDTRPLDYYIVVGPDYFDTVGGALLRGRAFQPGDGPEAPGVAIVTQRFAAQNWPGEDPIGRRMQVGAGQRLVSIVGVSQDVQHYLDNEATPLLYLPFEQQPQRNRWLLIRSRGDAVALTAAVRGTVAALDPDLPVSDVSTLNDALGFSRWHLRLFGELFSIFAAAALLLAVVGVFAVSAHAIQRRTSEIGVRAALGASDSDIGRMVLTQAAGQLLAALAAGLPLAALSAKALGAVLFGVPPWDPLTLAAATLLLALAMLAANWIPARRAMRIEPAVALRHE